MNSDLDTRQPSLPVGISPPASVDLTALFMVLAAALMIGTILQQQKLDYCPNDGSRWNTIYYLVEHGTYEFKPDYSVSWMGGRGKDVSQLTPDQKEKWFKIGEKYYEKPWSVPPFWTIDMIRVKDKDGRDHYYSSKPPLMSTGVAGVVWLIEKLTLNRVDFSHNPWFIIRSTLILVHVLPFLVLLWLIRGHVYRASESPFVRNFCLAATALGTYLTAWSITLNNHVFAAVAALLAVHAVIRIGYDQRREWYWFAMAGFFASLTACLELPAGLLAVATAIVLFLKDRRRTLIVGLPAGLFHLAAGLITNYLSIGRLKPAYMDFGKPGGLYDYPGSYWTQMSGIDALKEPKWTYLMHITIGHHGFFLLTPILLLSLVGILIHLARPGSGRRVWAAFVLALSAVVTAVYTLTTNNYGGTAEGARWLFWLTPLWLLFLADGVARLEKWPLGRAMCYLLLAVSVMSVGFALRTPWADSWAHLLFRQLKWINY